MYYHRFLGDLRRRLLLLVLALVVPVALLTARGYFKLSDNELHSTRQDLRHYAFELSSDIRAQVESARHTLAVLAATDWVKAEDPAYCNWASRKVVEATRTFSNVSVFDGAGNFLCGSDRPSVPINVADRDWFRHAMRTREFAVGPLIMAGRLTGIPTVVFGQPLINGERTVARVVSVSISAARLREVLEAGNLPRHASARLVDAWGVTIARVPAHAEWLGRPVEEPQLMEAVRNRLAASIITMAPGWTYVAAPVHEKWRDLYVLLGLPDQVAPSVINRTFLENIVAFAAVALLVAGVAWFASDRIIVRNVDNELRHGLLGTVTALANAVDARDPYTAGHQSRVAHLATAIGERMGLDADPLEGLRLGALAHDIGKLGIPLKVLTKREPLTEAEYGLVKTHPRAGHAILKNVDFRWPVAEMVHQHHENLDGSGYPRGLKGDQIILEARILAVADVVEAMSSPRPYRPALGQTAALACVEAHAGTRFDPDVVAACVSLFHDHGYQLPSPLLREFAPAAVI